VGQHLGEGHCQLLPRLVRYNSWYTPHPAWLGRRRTASPPSRVKNGEGCYLVLLQLGRFKSSGQPPDNAVRSSDDFDQLVDISHQFAVALRQLGVGGNVFAVALR